MHERFFVVSIVEVGDRMIPRIIFENANKRVCQEHADKHWAEEADEGELVFVAGNHDKAVRVAQAAATC